MRRDDELGFVQAAVDVAKMGGKGLAKLGKAVKKRKAAKKARAAESAGSPATAHAHAKRAVAGVPPNVRGQVLAAIKDAARQGAHTKQTLNTISSSVDKSLQPKVKKMLTALKKSALTRQATYEHEQLAAKAKFESGVSGSLADISDKIARIEARLARSVIMPSARARIFGQRDVLES